MTSIKVLQSLTSFLPLLYLFTSIWIQSLEDMEEERGRYTAPHSYKDWVSWEREMNKVPTAKEQMDRLQRHERHHRLSQEADEEVDDDNWL